MKITDEAVTLTVTTHSESSKIIKCLTKNHGIFSGFVKNTSIKNSNLTIGSLIQFNWNARLEEHIGILKFELIKSYTHYFLFDKKKLISISCLLDIISSTFGEREHINGLFDLLTGYLEHISCNDFDFKKYISIELEILRMAGYGLKLDRCNQTGTNHDLLYVSPKTGCAISREAGEQYRHKLLILPDLNLEIIPEKEREYALTLTGYFFERYVYKNIKHILPESRKLLSSQ
jgi:DNA repair protein RecO (recombination protein O)